MSPVALIKPIIVAISILCLPTRFVDIRLVINTMQLAEFNKFPNPVPGKRCFCGHYERIRCLHPRIRCDRLNSGQKGAIFVTHLHLWNNFCKEVSCYVFQETEKTDQ